MKAIDVRHGPNYTPEMALDVQAATKIAARISLFHDEEQRGL